MSILLDAVTKEKRQNQDPIDFVTQVVPHAQTMPKRTIPRWLVTGGMLIGTIAVGVGLAWLMNKVLQPNHAQPKTPTSLTAVNTKVSHSIPSAVDVTPTNTSEVRLAGKVALPIAKVYSANQTPVSQVVQQQIPSKLTQPSANELHAINSSTQVQKMANQTPPSVAQTGRTLTSKVTDSGITLAHLQALSNEYDQQNGLNTAKQPQSQPTQKTAGQTTVGHKSPDVTKPIVLGKDAEHREQEQLAALKYEVNNAADDVHYGDTQAKEVEHNNLMHAFKAALQDVEYEHATAEPMSKGDLAPIPKTSDKLIPTYGELPASVQLKVPEFRIVAHVYSTDPTQRWLNVDGAELQQGDKIDDKMTIIEIRPRDVILDIDGEEFKVPAM